MYQICELAKLDSKELIEKRDQAIREKKNFQDIIKSAAPKNIIDDAKKQIKFLELRIKEMNDELTSRAIAHQYQQVKC